MSSFQVPPVELSYLLVIKPPKTTPAVVLTRNNTLDLPLMSFIIGLPLIDYELYLAIKNPALRNPEDSKIDLTYSASEMLKPRINEC